MKYTIIAFFTTLAIGICIFILNIDTFIVKSVPVNIQTILGTYNKDLFSGQTESLASFAYQEDADFLKSFTELNNNVSTFLTSQKAEVYPPKTTSFSIEKDLVKGTETVRVSLQFKFVQPIISKDKTYLYYNEDFTFSKVNGEYKITYFELTPTNEEVNYNFFMYILLPIWLLIFALCLFTSLFYVINHQSVRTYWLFIIFLVPFGFIFFWILRPYRYAIVKTD